MAKDNEELYWNVFLLKYECIHVSDIDEIDHRIEVIHLAQPQIIGMSATLANIDDLLKFLDAQFYEERFRPV